MRLNEMLRLARPPSILLLGVLYVAYVLAGGVVFWQLEGHLVQQHVGVLLSQKQRLLGTYACLDQGALEEVAQVSNLSTTWMSHRNPGAGSSQNPSACWSSEEGHLAL